MNGITSNYSNSQSFGRRNSEIVKVQEYPEGYVYTIKNEASTGKKVGVGLASTCVPGLGQAVNGQWGKATAFFFGSMLAQCITTLPIIMSGDKNDGKLLNPKINSTKMLLPIIVAMGIGIWSIVDAVKNASTETTQIVPKSNLNIQG